MTARDVRVRGGLVSRSWEGDQLALSVFAEDVQGLQKGDRVRVLLRDVELGVGEATSYRPTAEPHPELVVKTEGGYKSPAPDLLKFETRRAGPGTAALIAAMREGR